MLLWARHALDIDRLLHGRRSAAAGCECGQCHVVSVRRKLNTDSVLYYCLNFAALRYSQDDVEDDGELNAAIDDADLLAGNVYDLGRVVLEEAAENGHVAAHERHDDYASTTYAYERQLN